MFYIHCLTPKEILQLCLWVKQNKIIVCRQYVTYGLIHIDFGFGHKLFHGKNPYYIANNFQEAMKFLQDIGARGNQVVEKRLCIEKDLNV